MQENHSKLCEQLQFVTYQATSINYTWDSSKEVHKSVITVWMTIHELYNNSFQPPLKILINIESLLIICLGMGGAHSRGAAARLHV